MGDVNFGFNPVYTVNTNYIKMTDEQIQLANLKGIGNLRDLNQSAALSDDLENILKEYSIAASKEEQLNLIDKLIEEWAKTDKLFDDISYTFTPAYIRTSSGGIALTPTQEAGLNKIIILPDNVRQELNDSRFKLAIINSFSGQKSKSIY